MLILLNELKKLKNQLNAKIINHIRLKEYRYVLRPF